MCVIIFKDYEKSVPEYLFDNSFRINSDGIGLYATNGTDEVIEKSMTYYNFKETIEKYNDPAWRTVYHFRKTTAGLSDLKNCHPFNVGNGFQLFHNGTVYSLSLDKRYSDSNLFAKTIGMVKNFRGNLKAIKNIVECLDVSRFLVIDKSDYVIINEDDGIWKEGVWYSKRDVLDCKPLNNKVFVYGTLKDGGSNNYFMKRGAKYVGDAETCSKFPMIIKGLPYVINRQGEGNTIKGEYYMVDDSTLERLDGLEGHPSFYKRVKQNIRVKINTGNSVHFKYETAWIYMVDDSYLTKNPGAMWVDFYDAKANRWGAFGDYKREDDDFDMLYNCDEICDFCLKSKKDVTYDSFLGKYVCADCSFEYYDRIGDDHKAYDDMEDEKTEKTLEILDNIISSLGYGTSFSVELWERLSVSQRALVEEEYFYETGEYVE